MIFKIGYPINPYKLTQGFGENPEYYQSNFGLKGHNGQDLYAFDGQRVYASHDGKVVFSGENWASGLTVCIRTNDKFEYASGDTYFKTVYCHLQSIVVKANDQVKKGDLIAYADNTGKSTGSHLHFGLKPVYQGENDWDLFNVEQANGFNGSIDPAPYFDGTYAHDPNDKFSFSKNMKFGETSDDVKKLQNALISLGYSIPAGATGYYGNQTAKAVLKFQVDHKVDTLKNLMDNQGHYFYNLSRVAISRV